MRAGPALLSLVTAVAALAGSSSAQPADGTTPSTDSSTTTAPSSGAPMASSDATTDDSAVEKPNPVQFGVGFRLRNVRIPKAELELFVERAGNGASNVGLGLEFIRRRGDVELQFGLEYERLTVGDGVWIEKGANVAAGDEADYILSPDRSGEQFGWLTIEFTFLNHSKISKQFAIRYGGGAGLGILLGSLERYDVICVGATNEMPEPGCVPPAVNVEGRAQPGGDGSGSPRKYDLPPVFPVVNAIIGLQFRPNDNITINLEGGIRTLLFFGLSGAYLF